MAGADLSSSAGVMKPLLLAAIKLAKGKGAGDKGKKKAEVKMKLKSSVKVKHG